MKLKAWIFRKIRDLEHHPVEMVKKVMHLKRAANEETIRSIKTEQGGLES